MLGLVLHLAFMGGVFFVTNSDLLFVMVFVFGVSVTARYYVGYTYNVEMQPKSHYVLVSTTQFVFESLCYLFICVYFWFITDKWKLLQIPNVALCVVGLVFLYCMPESPRFLVSTRQFTKAREVFAWIGKVNGISQEEIKERLNEIVFEGELKPKPNS